MLLATPKATAPPEPPSPVITEIEGTVISKLFCKHFADDNALTGGIAFFRGKSVVAIGIDKGKNTQDRIHKNFGMARPEGYRKAERLMQLANDFSIPVLMFVDTAGAYPGKGAEQRGQAEAIAKCLQKSLEITVPSISVITGEGGSGGAVALGVANNTLMLEHAIYSVISLSLIHI